MFSRILFACICICAFFAPAVAQTSCNAISEAEQNTYGFRPSKLTNAEREQKSAAMDEYWSLVKRSGAEGVSCLRGLVAKQNDGFAVFDESMLLYSLDHSNDSLRVIVDALPKTEFTDVQTEEYVRMGLLLARQGLDIKHVAHSYISAKSDVTAYLARHGGYKLDRVAGAILLYGSMPTDAIDDALSVEVKSDDPETRNAAAVVWSLNLTPRSFKGLAALGDMKDFSDVARRQVLSTFKVYPIQAQRPKYSREQMLAKIAKFPELDMDSSADPEQESKALDNSVYATFKPEDVARLRESRRKFITGVSNEAVEGYTEMSRVLLMLINKLNLYPEYRNAR